MQRLTQCYKTGFIARWMLSVLLVAMVSVDAQAERPVITGVAPGQIVTEPVLLGATGDAQTTGLMLQLIGPGGYSQVATADGATVCFQVGPGGAVTAWDPAGYPQGKYLLTATAQRSTRGKGRLLTQSLWFSVARPQPVEAAPEPLIEGPEAILTFGEDAPERRVEGNGLAIELIFSGALPDDGDVMLLCWDEQRRRLVPEFTAFLQSGPWRISAEQLNRLPTGRMELQAHLRRGGRVVQSARHPIQIDPFVPVAAAQPDSETNLFEAVNDALTTSTHGTVGGVGGGGETSAPAASSGRGGSGRPRAAAGPGGTNAPAVAAAEAVPSVLPGTSAPAVLVPPMVGSDVAETETAQNATPDDAAVPSAQNVAVAPVTSPEVTSAPVVAPAAPAVSPTAVAAAPRKPVAPASSPAPITRFTPTTTAAPSRPAGGATQNPVVVLSEEPGQDVPTPNAENLPRGTVVEVEAWSIDQSRLVHTFAHTLDRTPLVINSERLRGLPEGRVELQFTAVVDGQRRAPTFRTISVAGALVDAGSGGLDVANAQPVGGGFAPSTSQPQGPSPDAPVAAAPVVGGAAPEPSGGTRRPGAAPSVAVAPSPAPAVSRPPTPGPAPASPPEVADPPQDPTPTQDPAVADVDLDGLDAVGTGFTVFAPSTDTRTIYVSASGDDANAGTSPSAPVATMLRARDLIRDGMPDHVRFKAGDTFTFGLGVFNKSGRSADEPIVFGVYGDGPRPKFEVSAENFLFITDRRRSVENLVVQGLHAEAVTRNPNLPGFEPDAAIRPREVHRQTGIFIFGDVSNVVIEDCFIDWFKDGLVFQGKPNENLPINNLTLRRCIITNSYSVTQEGHSQGMYAELVHGLTLEENLFDHNGWCESVEGAHRTKFNHNVYIQYSATDVELTGNVLTRGASHGAQVRPGGQVVNNLFVRNALATFVARSKSLVAHNVVLQADDISAENPRGFGIEVFPGPDTRVINNVLSTRIGSAFFAEPIGLSVDRNNLTRYSGPTRVELTDNKIFRWPIEFGRVLPIRYNIPDAVVVEARNAIDVASGSDSDPPWIDPTRNVESYMGSLNRTPTFEAFIQEAAARPRGQWLPELTASAVNTYVRRGFEVPVSD